MERTYEHAMCDLETLGTRPGAMLLSIGLCPFDVRGIAPPADRLHLILSRSDSAGWGFLEDPATLGWWGQQSWEAQATLREATAAGLSVPDALRVVSGYLAGVAGIDQRGLARVCLWGNGADFDNALLAEAYARVGLAAPWPFYRNRCFRTLKSLGRTPEPRREGTHHNALDDAVHQARWAVAILRQLEPETERPAGA